MNEQHTRIASLVQQNRLDDATKMALELLDQNRDDSIVLFQLGVIMLKENRKGLAYNLLARACRLSPERPEMWINYARSHLDRPENWGRIEWCIRKALKLYKKANSPSAPAYADLAMLCYIKGDLESAQMHSKKALSIEPLNKNALVARGFVHLAKGEWLKAWTMYDVMLETGKRENYSYGDEPEWNGDKGKRLIVSGEQGLGDELMYASCFKEVIKDSSEVIIDCMPRLQGLFQRSFPQTKVYGQRWNKEVIWEEDHNPEAHVAMATIPKFYRKTDKDFGGDPYLIPHPDIKAACAGMLKNLGNKPRIGITWTGGSDRTRGYLRERSLEELVPILRQDATFISLEYHDRSDQIRELEENRSINIHSFPWLTKIGLDYDYTAALVSELDLVITVPTTVVQTAGGLGIECWVMVPKYTGWIFARDVYPWAKSVVPMRNISIKDISERLAEWLLTRSQTSKLRLLTG